MKPRMVIGERYNWRGQPERLIYMGRPWSGNGYWHQFALVDKPDEVWCEVLDDDLDSFEVSVQEITVKPRMVDDRGLDRNSALSSRQQKKARKAAKRATQAAKQGEQP